ncbi:hypothetical protein J4734_23970 [Klebsiella pneumoniae]|uniref:Uncharacterized protein n=1 Tax=Klebsiella pneumoniae TaxID=573 RepID=A0A939NNK5_KLEPN|nr:hypothetical protein [Klebsiella pneumoniae]
MGGEPVLLPDHYSAERRGDYGQLPGCADRRKWVQRILDHDGSHGEDGGIEARLRLGKRSV